MEAQDYKKLVDALRSASTVSTAWEKLMRDAADAIEKLVTLYEKAEIDATNLTGKLAQAEAQLPKQGEWKRDEKRWGDNLIRCSLCGAVIEDDEWGWRNYYCYHCGAKMKVWDGESNN